MQQILAGTAEGRRVVPGIVDLQTLLAMTEMSRGVFVNPLIYDYITRLVNQTRLATEVRLGVSVRGAISLARLVVAWALSRGRIYVVPDDVQRLAVAALAHRIVLEPEAEFDGVTAEAVIGQILLDVPAPEENTTA